MHKRQKEYQRGLFLLKWVFLIFFWSYTLVLVDIAPKVTFDNRTKSDALIVLGATTHKGDAFNPCLVSRVKHAAQLFKEGYAEKIIVTGGTDLSTGINEAETMKTIAKSFDVSGGIVLLEKEATSTYENMVKSKYLAKANNLDSFLIVTEPFHSPRALLVAKNLGMNVTVSPAVDSPCWTRWTFLSRFFLREPLVILYYKATGKL